VRGKNTLGISLLNPPLADVYAQHKRERKKMEIATVIGAPPAVFIASIFKVPRGIDKLSVAGGLKGEPVETTMAGTVVKLEAFRDSYYASTGAPSDYASDVVVYKDGQEVQRHTIRVNDPLRVGDTSFFQSFYGPAAQMTVTDKTGKPVLAEGVPLAWSTDDGARKVGTFTIPSAGLTAWVIGTSGGSDTLVKPGQMRIELYESGGQVHVVLTRRAQHLRSHRGEVSFPGGGQDPGEDLWQTALREAREETALDPASVELIGELDHLRTITSRSFIVPYVGELPGRPDLVASPNEVEHILHVPLSELLAEGVFREERWGIASMDRPIYFFELVGDTIWGATAAMLRNLLALLTGTDHR